MCAPCFKLILGYCLHDWFSGFAWCNLFLPTPGFYVKYTKAKTIITWICSIAAIAISNEWIWNQTVCILSFVLNRITKLKVLSYTGYVNGGHCGGELVIWLCACVRYWPYRGVMCTSVLKLVLFMHFRIFYPKPRAGTEGQVFKPSAAHLYPNTGRVTPQWRLVEQLKYRNITRKAEFFRWFDSAPS